MRCVRRLIGDRGQRRQLAKRSTAVALPAARWPRARSVATLRCAGSAHRPALPLLVRVPATRLDWPGLRRDSFPAIVGTRPLRWHRTDAQFPGPADTWRAGYAGLSGLLCEVRRSPGRDCLVYFRAHRISSVAGHLAAPAFALVLSVALMHRSFPGVMRAGPSWPSRPGLLAPVALLVPGWRRHARRLLPAAPPNLRRRLSLRPDMPWCLAWLIRRGGIQ